MEKNKLVLATKNRGKVRFVWVVEALVTDEYTAKEYWRVRRSVLND